METYATALLYAIPFFIGLVLIEIAYGSYKKKIVYELMDTISSLSSGLTNIIKDSLGLVLVIVSYPWLYEHLQVWNISGGWITYFIGFIFIDFAGYWNHRLSHHVNIFWNQHVIHHSSEEFNLACALRQSISNLIGYFPLMLLPAALIGIPPQVINIIAPLQLFAQFWYHTQHIGKLGWLEYIIVTPSQHRVHHAINAEYVDKNLGQVLCLWDRLFGTFQEELAEVPPAYGVLKPAHTWNPVLINFQHFFRLCRDAWYTKRWWDKIRIWFMPKGWRPEDVKILFPTNGITDVYQFEKYRTPSPKHLIYYSLLQLVSTTALMLYLFARFGDLGTTSLLSYGLLIFLAIFGYTSLMDHRRFALYWEFFRGIIGLSWVFYFGWFGLEKISPMWILIIYLYFAITALYPAVVLLGKRSLKSVSEQ